MTRKELKQLRLRQVEKLLALQMGHAAIVRQVAKEHNVTERQVWYDVQHVYKRIEEENVKERPMMRHQMRATLRNFYQRALLAQQWAAALGALDRLIKLDGLAEPEMISVQHGGTVGLSLGALGFRSSAEVRERIIELQQRVGSNGKVTASLLTQKDGEDNGGNGHANGNGAGNGHNAPN